MNQEQPLLASKTSIPPCQSLVIRKRLCQCLDEGMKRRLTLISASAGCGKTSLLASWSQHCNLPVSWLSLDEGDDDPGRFLLYFIHALDFPPNLKEELLALLRMPMQNRSRSVEAILARILREITKNRVLVLEDYHRIGSQEIHEAVGFLLENAPPNFHLVIATRCEPPLPLARLRLNEQTLEIRDPELRFTNEESASYFEKRTQQHLSEDEIARLTLFTEGWIAGMKLVVLSLEQCQDPSEFIKRFEGRNRHIFDYLSEEIFNRQTEEVREFLLRTSILESFGAPLCDALTKRTDGQKTLETLEKNNLFIVPLDQERRFYRYHHLFSEFLQNRLLRDRPLDIPIMHRLAAAWHEKKGGVAESIAHFLMAEDFEQAGRLIEHSAKSLLMQNRIPTLMGWLNRLPAPWLRSQPELCAIRGWCLVQTFQLDEVDSWLRQTTESNAESAEILAIRAVAALQRGEKALDLAEKALEGLSEKDAFSYNIVSMALGLEYASLGQYHESSEIFRKTVRLSRGSGDLFSNILGLANLAHNEKELGNLKKGLEYAEQGSEHPLPIISVPCALMGLILYEMNEIDKAIRYLKKAIALDTQWGNLDNQLFGSLLLWRLLKVNEEAGEEVWAEIERLSKNPELSYVLPWVALFEAREPFIEGKLEAAEKWLEERGDVAFSLDGPLRPLVEQELEFLADLRLAKGQPDQALRISGHLLEHAEKSGKLRTAISGRLLEALGRRQKGELNRAFDLLEEALALARPQNFIRIFLERGAAMATLLGDFLAEKKTREEDFARKILLILKSAAIRASFSTLTEREREVLDFINSGKTNNEIAEDICVTVATVKKHINSIYAKLDIKDRNEAREIAENVGRSPHP